MRLPVPLPSIVVSYVKSNDRLARLGDFDISNARIFRYSGSIGSTAGAVRAVSIGSKPNGP